MTRVDRNTQLLADAYCGADRTPYQGIQFDWGSIGPTAMGSVAAFCAIPPLFSTAFPNFGRNVRTPISAFSKWRNDPLVSSWSQAYDEAVFENNLEKQNMRFLTNEKLPDGTFGKKYSFGKRFMFKQRYNAISEIGLKMPDEISTPTGEITPKQQVKINNQQVLKQEVKELDEIKKLIKEAKEGKINPKDLKAHYKTIMQKLQQADITINDLKAAGKIKPTSTLGKASHWLKGKTGYYKAKGFVLKSPKAFKALKLAGKGIKGSAILYGVGETICQIDDVMEAKQIDDYERSQGRQSNRMKKQIRKSAVIVGAATAGSIAGGALAGAALGTACGSVVPIVGNIVGFIGGLIGGAFCGWLAKKATGPSEVDKYKEKQNDQAKKNADELAKQASNDNNVKDEMLNGLLQAKEEGQLDDKKLLAILEDEVAIRKKEIAESYTCPQDNTYVASNNLDTQLAALHFDYKW